MNHTETRPTADGENERDARIDAIPDIHGHAKGEHKPYAEERPIPYTARMLFLWFYHACRRGSPRYMMVADHINYLTFEDPAAVNLVRRALKLASAGDLYGAAETAGVELQHAAVVSEGLRKGMRYSIGAEVDNDPRSRPDAQNIVDAMRPDGIIRSVHFLPITHPVHGENWMWPFDNPEFADLFDHVGVAQTWELYMATLLDAIDKLPGHIVGHFYVPAKFGHWPDDATLEAYEDRLIEACAAKGMSVEINARPFYRLSSDPEHHAKYREANLRLLRKAKAAGVGIAAGSDAHSPKDQGNGMVEVLAMLDDADVNVLTFPINGRLAAVALRVTEDVLAQQKALAEAAAAQAAARAAARAIERDGDDEDDSEEGTPATPAAEGAAAPLAEPMLDAAPASESAVSAPAAEDDVAPVAPAPAPRASAKPKKPKAAAAAHVDADVAAVADGEPVGAVEAVVVAESLAVTEPLDVTESVAAAEQHASADDAPTRVESHAQTVATGVPEDAPPKPAAAVRVRAPRPSRAKVKTAAEDVRTEPDPAPAAEVAPPVVAAKPAEPKAAEAKPEPKPAAKVKAPAKTAAASVKPTAAKVTSAKPAPKSASKTKAAEKPSRAAAKAPVKTKAAASKGTAKKAKPAAKKTASRVGPAKKTARPAAKKAARPAVAAKRPAAKKAAKPAPRRTAAKPAKSAPKKAVAKKAPAKKSVAKKAAKSRR
jgi:HisJ family histidinol phosphate phosphatase